MHIVQFNRKATAFWLLLSVVFFAVFFVAIDHVLFVLPSTLLTVGTTFLVAYFANQDGIADRRELFWWLSSISRPTVRSLGLAVLIAVIGVLLAFGVSIVRALVETQPQDVQHSLTTGTPDTQTIILLFTVIVIVVPLAEEWLMRGVLQRFLTRVATASIAIGLTSLIFALYHIPTYGGLAPGIVWPILVVFIHSLLWGWLYYRTGNVLVTWVAHGLTNCFAFANWLWV